MFSQILNQTVKAVEAYDKARPKTAPVVAEAIAEAEKSRTASGRRTTTSMQLLKTKVVDYIQRNPACKCSTIAKAFQMPVPNAQQILYRLLDDKAVTRTDLTKGESKKPQWGYIVPTVEPK